MNVGKYFTLTEMIESPTARRKGFAEQFTPPAAVVTNLQKLCTNILDPLRDAVGPINITSGYRCQRTNEAKGGAETSQHLAGEAADINATNKTNAELFTYIRNSNLPYDQLIWEYGTNNNPAWVHVSFGSRNRRQVIIVGEGLSKKKILANTLQA